MTSVAPGATSAAPSEPRDPKAAQSHRGRYPHDWHDRRPGPDLGRLQHLHAGSDRRRPLPHAAQPLEPERPDVIDRDHGDGHGAHHRHAPYRPFGRIDHRLRLDHHRRRAGPYPAGLSRPRQSCDLGHRRCRRPRDRRGDRRISRLAGRLSRYSRLHCHARRPIVLARGRMVGDDGPDHRAARRPLRADGRGPAWLDRATASWALCAICLRRHLVQPLFRQAEAGAIPLPATTDVGRISRLRPSDVSSSLARQRSSTPIPGPSGSRRDTPPTTIFRCRKAACTFRPAMRSRC